MPWRLLQFLMPNTTAFQAITKELKEMKDEWKQKAREQEKKIEELQRQVHDLERHEEDCHRSLIRIRQEYSDLKERLIFLTKGRHNEE